MSKVCLVTGASRGIGRATVEHLSGLGYTVYAGVRESREKNEAAASELRKICRVIDLDVTCTQSVDDAVKSILDSTNRLDAVVNNAGYGLWGAAEEIDIEAAQRLFDVNFFGCLRVSKAAIPIMRNQGDGVIVQVSSISGRVVGPLYGMYQASKHALEAMSEAMAYELGHFGVRVVLVEPGNVDTNCTVEFAPALLEGRSYYQELMSRLNEARKGITPKRSTANDVALTITSAIENRSSPLRLLVGDDAYTLDAQRRALPDAEFSNWLWKEKLKVEW
ncbi:SDR family oxidoreductase [Viridibacterium curvum]|uniref:Oxidoreductase n=1 Tax=Viridibacterium curvum TaxID=1101404 RepID=A0ABP9R8N0_9RHOO